MAKTSLTALQLSTSISHTRNDTVGHKEIVTPKRQDMKNWSLDKDWILQDAVPRYTVVSGSNSQHQVTFWNQLKHATSEFKGRGDYELEQRFRTLHQNANLICGPAPPTLTNWWLDDTKHMMGGTVSNGSMIWFYIQSGGRLDNTHQMEVLFAPGGFVEAKDGLVYELGPTSAPPNKLESIEQATVELSPQFLIDSAQHARKMLLTAITVSSVLSATLAYGIGQQMPSFSPSPLTPQDSHTLTVNVRTQSSQSPAVRPKVSIQEQRARQELKLIREQRAKSYIEQEIQKDEEKLSVLQKEETIQEGKALGFY